MHIQGINWASRTSWGWWDDTAHTWCEIQTLEVWGRARYLSVTEAPHNTAFHEWMGTKHFCFLQAAETGKRTPNSTVKSCGAKHYPRAPPTGQVSSQMKQDDREIIVKPSTVASVIHILVKIARIGRNILSIFSPLQNNIYRCVIYFSSASLGYWLLEFLSNRLETVSNDGWLLHQRHSARTNHHWTNSPWC